MYIATHEDASSFFVAGPFFLHDEARSRGSNSHYTGHLLLGCEFEPKTEPEEFQ